MNEKTFEEIEMIFWLAGIRRFIHDNMPENTYFDVMERVIIPSKDGDYSSFDILILAYSKEEKDKISNFIENRIANINIGIICL